MRSFFDIFHCRLAKGNRTGTETGQSGGNQNRKDENHARQSGGN
jgi:hypothetical protein